MSPGLAQSPGKDQATTSYTMDAHTFTLALPAGYKLAMEDSSIPAYKMFGFSTDPREDGTSGVIQVSLFDFKKRGSESITLDDFAAMMVSTMRRGRGDWKSTESPLELIGVQARRVEWSGSVERAPNEPVALHGVMILGIKDHVGFRLEVQDTESRATQNLPPGEKALKSFVLHVKR